MVKSLRLKLQRVICKHQPNYDLSATIDPEIKILSFITYFVYCVLKRKSIKDVIDLLDQQRIVETYITMMESNEEIQTAQSIIDKITSLSSENKEQILITSTYATPLVKLLEPLLKNNNIDLPTDELAKLIDLIIKLLLINYHTPQLKTLAKDNLNDNYQQQVEFIVIQTVFVGEIHKLLKKILPGNVNPIVIFINYLLKPFKK